MIPLGVVWVGYTLVWYGYCLIKGDGVGITDLIKPSGVVKVNGFLKGNGSGNGSSSSSSTPPPPKAKGNNALPEQLGPQIR